MNRFKKFKRLIPILFILLLIGTANLNSRADTVQITDEPLVMYTESVKPVKPVKTVATTTNTINTKVGNTNTKKEITFRVTAYCSCSKCCGNWANKREKDKNGKDIVVGATGNRLYSNYSCASPLPFGTKIKLMDLGTFVVQDRTADWVVDKHGKYIVDIYTDNHQQAKNFGVRYIKGVID